MCFKSWKIRLIQCGHSEYVILNESVGQVPPVVPPAEWRCLRTQLAVIGLHKLHQILLLHRVVVADVLLLFRTEARPVLIGITIRRHLQVIEIGRQLAKLVDVM